MLESQHLHVDFSDISRRVSADAIRQRMLPWVTQAAQAVKGEIASRMPIGATGQASRSVFYKIDSGSPDSLEATVYVPPGIPAGAYAWYIEHPRKSGRMPPVESLFGWVRRKLSSALRADRVRSGSIKSRSTSVKTEESLVRSVAWAVARSIAKRGTYKNPSYPSPEPFKNGWVASERNALAIIERGQSQLIAQLGE